MCNIECVGRVRMQAVENNKNEPAFLKEYPFVVPKVVLEGYEDPNLYAGGTNSVVLVRGRIVTIYTDGSFAEFLEKDEDGNVDWVDSRKGHDDDCKSFFQVRNKSCEQWLCDELARHWGVNCKSIKP